MTECQGCGAWNERCRTLCVLCGTPLAETDEWDTAAEPPPLPPLPDGGLSVTMPAWLRATPDTPVPHVPQLMVVLAPVEEPTVSTATSANPAGAHIDLVAVADSLEPAPVGATPAELPLGPQADPRTFLRDDDFPRWIRELPALPPRPALPVTMMVPPATEPAVLVAPPANPVPPLIPFPGPAPVLPAAAQQEVSPVVGSTEPDHDTPSFPATPGDSTVHRREAWETPLLVLLVVGVVVAVIWALLVNGMIGSGL